MTEKKKSNRKEPTMKVSFVDYAAQLALSRVIANQLRKQIIIINERLDDMDKKMAKVTKEMKMAEKDIKKGKPKKAVKELKKATKKNVKLTKIDREERDPMLKKCKKTMMKKGTKSSK